MFTDSVSKLVYCAVVLVFLLIIFYKLSTEKFSEFGNALNNKSNHYKQITNLSGYDNKQAGNGEFRNELDDAKRHYRDIAGIREKTSVLKKIGEAIGVVEHGRFNPNEDPQAEKWAKKLY